MAMPFFRKLRVGSIFVALFLGSYLPASNARADIGVVSPEGQQLAAYLDSWQVQSWWPTIPVNWQTGSPNTPVNSTNVTLTGTHCSDFTTAAAWPLGIYILRPPIYPDGWHDMANYQDLWYKTNSKTAYGWLTITNSSTNMIQAQDLANQGYLVIACYLNPDINDSGHTAVIHPWSNTVNNITAYGPAECQAGTYNYNLTNIATGFNEHPGAFPGNIDYFYHPVTYPVTPVNPVLTNVTVTNGILYCQVSSLTGRNYQLQLTTDFTHWANALSYTNSDLPTTLMTVSNFSVTAPQVCSFGVRVVDAYGVSSAVVTQSLSFTGIIINGPAVTNVALGATFIDPGATATENCATNLPVTTNGAVNVNEPGVYPITYTATVPGGTQVTGTRTVNVVGFIHSYETSLTAGNWKENFDELGNNSANPPPTGWVFAQGTGLPLYNNPLTAVCTFSTNAPQSWTTNLGLSSPQNSQCFTRCSDSTTNQNLTSGGRVNCGDASTANTNRAVGFATSNPSWQSPTNYLMFGFVNNLETNAIVSATLDYNVKRYKQGLYANAAVTFYYSTNGTAWIHAAAGDVGPYAVSASLTNYLFTTQPEVTNRTFTLNGLNVPGGSPFYLCWQFVICGSSGGSSLDEHILALDDFELAVSNAPTAEVIPAPHLERVTALPGGGISFSWSAVSGASYQVQFTTGLNPSGWINLGSPLVATNTTMTFTDPPAEDVSQRFYRVEPVSP